MAKDKVVDSYLSAIKYSNKTIIIDNEDKDIYNGIKADKNLAKVYKQSSHSEILTRTNNCIYSKISTVLVTTANR